VPACGLSPLALSPAPLLAGACSVSAGAACRQHTHTRSLPRSPPSLDTRGCAWRQLRVFRLPGPHTPGRGFRLVPVAPGRCFPSAIECITALRAPRLVVVCALAGVARVLVSPLGALVPGLPFAPRVPHGSPFRHGPSCDGFLSVQAPLCPQRVAPRVAPAFAVAPLRPALERGFTAGVALPCTAALRRAAPPPPSRKVCQAPGFLVLAPSSSPLRSGSGVPATHSCLVVASTTPPPPPRSPHSQAQRLTHTHAATPVRAGCCRYFPHSYVRSTISFACPWRGVALHPLNGRGGRRVHSSGTPGNATDHSYLDLDSLRLPVAASRRPLAPHRFGLPAFLHIARPFLSVCSRLCRGSVNFPLQCVPASAFFHACRSPVPAPGIRVQPCSAGCSSGPGSPRCPRTPLVKLRPVLAWPAYLPTLLRGPWWQPPTGRSTPSPVLPWPCSPAAAAPVCAGMQRASQCTVLLSLSLIWLYIPPVLHALSSGSALQACAGRSPVMCAPVQPCLSRLVL